MNTKDYRTRSIFKESNNKKLPGNYWPVGLDLGYSAVKVFSGNAVSCFPSYAEESSNTNRISLLRKSDPSLILYRDESGAEWTVGAEAQNCINVSDTTASSLVLYGRNRYYSPMFKVLARVGLAAGCRKNEFGDPTGKKILVQTGLPPKYIQSDTAMLKEVLIGRHEFSVKFGSNGKWENFVFDFTEQDIMVVDQPMGTLFSIYMDNEMKMTPNTPTYSSSRVLILDPGFGTFDTYPVVNSAVRKDMCQTFEGLGMKQVLADTAKEIFEKYNFEIPVPAMQRFLETGEVISKIPGEAVTKARFDDILEKHSRDICDKAIDKVFEAHNPAVEFDYVILTGGTGAAWSNYVRSNRRIRECGTFQIINGNAGDPELQILFSNVRGYYVIAYGHAAQLLGA